MAAAPQALAGPALAPDQTVRSFGDLDGDLRPDSIRYSLKGADHRGYSYLVEFDMSARQPSTPIAVHAADSWGLQIVARDVDGDHDLDLVVTSGSHGQAVDVWINDGQGGFRSAGVTGFPASIWIPEQTLAAAGFVPVRDASLALSDGWSAVLSASPVPHPVKSGADLRCPSAGVRGDCTVLDNAGPRAPPLP